MIKMAIEQENKEECPQYRKLNLMSTGSRHLCFFCLKDITPINIKIEEGTNIIPPLPCYVDNGLPQFQFPLRNISRFLKFSGAERSKSNEGIVNTCADCYKLSEEFTELYKELDVVQLRMNWCLRRICEIMEKTGGVDSDSEARDFTSLRRKTISHGRQKIRGSCLPVVSLKRTNKAPEMEESRNKDVVSPPPSHPDTRKNIDPGTTGDDLDPVVGDNPKRECHRGLHDDSQPESEPVGHLLSEQSSPLAQLHEEQSTPSASPPATADADDHLSCPFCRAVFRVKHLPLHIQQTCLSGHILQYHCEHYFPTQKLEAISQLQYKRILVDLLFFELCVERMGQFHCPFCSSSFRPTATAKNLSAACLLRFKLHLLNEHKLELEGKLLLIQCDPELVEKLKACNSAGISCACGSYLPSARIHQAHRLHHCTMPMMPPMIQFLENSTREEMVEEGASRPAEGLDQRFEGQYEVLETPPSAPSAKRMRFSSEVELSPSSSHQSTREPNYPQITSRPPLQEQASSLPLDQQHLFNISQSQSSLTCNLLAWTNFRAEQNSPPINSNYESCSSHLPATGTSYLHGARFSTYHHNPSPMQIDQGNLMAEVDEHKHKVPEMFHCTVKVPRNCNNNNNTKEISHLQDKPSENVKEKLARILNQKNQNHKLSTDNPPASSCATLPSYAQAVKQVNAKFPDQQRNAPPMISRDKGTATTDNDVEKISCLYCNVTHSSRANGFEGPGLTIMHLMVYHMEHFFPNERKEGLVTEWQFKRIVADLLFTDFVQINDDQCRLCGKMYATRTGLESMRFLALKYHIVVNHYFALKGRLDSIQNDHRLTERLATCNPHGVECPCGTYLPTEICLAQHKRHCKLNVAAIAVQTSRHNYTQIHDSSPPALQTATVRMVESQETRTVEPEQWNCDKCGHLYFFKEMLEEHKKNECMAYYAFSNSVSSMLDCTTQETGDVAANMNQNSTWNSGNDTHGLPFWKLQ